MVNGTFVRHCPKPLAVLHGANVIRPWKNHPYWGRHSMKRVPHVLARHQADSPGPGSICALLKWICTNRSLKKLWSAAGLPSASPLACCAYPPTHHVQPPPDPSRPYLPCKHLYRRVDTAQLRSAEPTEHDGSQWCAFQCVFPFRRPEEHEWRCQLVPVELWTSSHCGELLRARHWIQRYLVIRWDRSGYPPFER